MARVTLGRPLHNQSKCATGQPPVDTSLPASKVIADSVKRSSRARVFHFYAPLCEIVSVPRNAPSALVIAERLAPGGKGKGKDEGPIAFVYIKAENGSDPGRLVSLQKTRYTNDYVIYFRSISHSLLPIIRTEYAIQPCPFAQRVSIPHPNSVARPSPNAPTSPVPTAPHIPPSSPYVSRRHARVYSHRAPAIAPQPSASGIRTE